MQPLVKAIFAKNLADTDEAYEALRAESNHTVYQVGRTVCSPCGGDLYSASLYHAFGTLKYGDILVQVEHVDEFGEAIPKSELTKALLGGYASKYQKVLRVFDIRTVDGVEELFQFAAEHGVTYGLDNLPGHLRRARFGDAVYDRVYELAGLQRPETPKLEAPCVSTKHEEQWASGLMGFLHNLFHK